MSVPVPSLPEEIRFSVYAVNLRAGELRKNGTRVKLEARPFQVLTILLEHPGAVVTRDELRSRLWPEGTFVDFDHGINSAVRKLRDALCDSAAAPRYIETVGRRGYRFIYPVENGSSPKLISVEVAGGRAQEQNRIGGAAVEPSAALRTGSHTPWRGWALGLSVLAALAVAAFVAVSIRHSHTVALSPADRLLLADIENRTSDAAFDGTLQPALRVKLSESPYLNLVPDAASRAALKEAGDSIGACRKLGAKALLQGTLESAASGSFRVRLAVLGCGGGNRMLAEEADAKSVDDVLPALDLAANSLRQRLGEPAESLQQFHTPLIQATTASVAALKAFSLGEDKRSQGQDYEAIPLYKMATDLDPGFSLAYARLGAIYANAQENTLAQTYFQKAFENRQRATERERLYLTTHYYYGSGDLHHAADAYELWRQVYPSDPIPANNLADIYAQLGQPDRALESAREALRLLPENGIVRGTAMQAYQRAGRFNEAKKLYDDSVAKKLDSLLLHLSRYYIAVAENDDAEMQRQLAWARGNQREGEMLNRAAWAAAAAGQFRRAHQYLADAERVSSDKGLREFAAAALLDDALFQADAGFTSKTRFIVDESLHIEPKSHIVRAFAALALARADERQRADELAQQVLKEAPQDTILTQIIVPSARGLLDSQRQKAAAAVQDFRVAEPYDLSRAVELSTAYYRGLAYLSAGQPDNAAAVFQKVIASRELAPISLYVPLAHLGLARAYRLAGNVEAARSEYQVFFSAWKNADPDIPLLRAARAEFAHLRTASLIASRLRNTD